MDHHQIAALERRITVLEAEAEIRRVQARYMFLCDTPCPAPEATTTEDRIALIMELYAEDAIWEGVGDYYDNQFGQLVGKQAITEHFHRFWGEKQDPELLLNAHYLTSEQIHVDPENADLAEGQWIHVQPWLFSDGTSLLRSSRLNNAFRKVGGQWLIARTRTENVFIAPLKENFASDYPATSVLLRT